MTTIKTQDRRARNFATVVYPESAPADWLDTLRDQHIPAFVSPLHDKDTDKDGSPKKAHYHVMLMFDGKKSVEQVLELFAMFGGVGCETVGSMRGYARYLCHLDDPDKAQYDPEDVQQVAGACYSDAIGLPIDRRKAIMEMQDFCRLHDIVEFSALLDYAAAERPDWHLVLTSSATVVMGAYLASRRYGSRSIPEQK